MRAPKRISLILFALIATPVLLVAIAIAIFYGVTVHSAKGGAPMIDRAPTEARRPDMAANGPASQILFGDLHVHTNYSADSFLQSYQIQSLDSRRTPADACDFARFCSQLDFWSINDHAESLTPDHWRATIDAVRACEATSGRPHDPDLVSFLGWEWSHAGLTAETHFGHKNVILADLEDEKIPTRPIASAPGPPWPFIALGTIGALVTDGSYADFASFHRYAFDTLEVEECASGVRSPDLPVDCRESATTPAELFQKLDEWDLRALVIPHGLAWGVTNPPHARLDVQLEQHDPKWQPLLEIYSGHGNSEVYSDFERPVQNPEGRWSCPAATADIEFCCERAGKLMRATCDDPNSDACSEQVDLAIQQAAALDSGIPLGSPTGIVPGSKAEDWGLCSQLDGHFLSSWNYRPRQSAQYALALGSIDGAPVENRYRLGFIGSSDTHRSRPGTGYSEQGRLVMTDGVGYPIPDDYNDQRQSAFYFSGGLAAVHSPRRDRDSIFDALGRREVYGTSGDRILLWFDFVSEPGKRQPMGSELVMTDGTPRFSVRAVGAQKQNEGCPDFVHDALSKEVIESLCLSQCHHPSDVRKRITRIEVVRITPPSAETAQASRGIEDPWRVFECPADAEGCEIEFEDPDYAANPREVAYYVRAIQEPSLAINGDPLQCERDDTGQCRSIQLCEGESQGRPNDCLALAEERAWSSPIFIRPQA
jgi:hypothetical protein